MKKLINKLKTSALKVQLAVRDFVSSEAGDTNFLSIAIILVVVLGLAVVFITFGKDLLPKLQEAINNLFGAF